MSDELFVRAAMHAAFGAPIDAAAIERGEHAVRAAATAWTTPAPSASASVLSIARRWVRTVPARAAAGVLAASLTFGTPGLAAAANRAAPGEGLYETKLLLERMWSAATPGSAATAAVHLRLATRRLDELESLPQGAPVDLRADLLDAARLHLDHADRLDPVGLAEAIGVVRVRLAVLAGLLPITTPEAPPAPLPVPPTHAIIPPKDPPESVPATTTTAPSSSAQAPQSGKTGDHGAAPPLATADDPGPKAATPQPVAPVPPPVTPATSSPTRQTSSDEDESDDTSDGPEPDESESADGPVGQGEDDDQDEEDDEDEDEDDD